MNKTKSLILIIAFLLAVPLAARDGLPYLGIDHFVVSDLPPVEGGLEATCGLCVSFPRCNAPAFWAGIRNGDIIIGFEGTPFTFPPEDLPKEFRAMIERRRTGDTVRLHILRMESDTSLLLDGRASDATAMTNRPGRVMAELPADRTLSFSLTKHWIRRTISVRLGSRLVLDLPPVPDFFDTAMGEWIATNSKATGTDWSSLAESAVDRYGFRREYSDLRGRLRAINTTSDGTRLSAVSTIHRHPEQGERIIRGLTGLIADSGAGILSAAGYITERPLLLSGSNPASLAPSDDEEGFRTWFEAALAPIRLRLEQAYSALSDKDRRFLIEHRFELTSYFVENTYIHADPDASRFDRNLRTLDLARKLDLHSLFEAAAGLERFIHSSSPDVFRWMEKHPQIRHLETTAGRVGFGTPGRDLWTDPDMVFIYDPDGDDFYGDGAAVADSFRRLMSWVVDLRGNDVYRSGRYGAQAYAGPGLAFLMDSAGEDSYLARRWGQGAGYMGVGVLIDLNGDDEYHGREYIQGTGLFGFGALIDRRGDDRYFADMYAQGIGMTRGMGILHDITGNDRGLCTGSQLSGFGDPGLFNGWGQGCGVGFRGLTSGGIGVVLDSGGSDRWEAGSFSMGCGYYFGIGIFHSAGSGDDLYYGTRYTIGNTAHQGVGVFFDDGGNDIYTTGQCETTGIAWDESVALFIEGGGDDYYYGGTGFDLGWIENKWKGFALGAAAQNGFAVFIDKGGRDHYDYPPGPGRADDNSYHGGFSFALFIDQGKDGDIYAGPDAGNDIERAWAQFGIFRDGEAAPIQPPRLLRTMPAYPHRRALNKN